MRNGTLILDEFVKVATYYELLSPHGTNESSAHLLLDGTSEQPVAG